MKLGMGLSAMSMRRCQGFLESFSLGRFFPSLGQVLVGSKYGFSFLMCPLPLESNLFHPQESSRSQG